MTRVGLSSLFVGLRRREVVCGLAALLSGCRRASTTTSSATAARVVSLSPSTTEAMALLGARAQLVGRSRYCDHPPDVLSLPIVGGFTDPNFEAIVALRPDLVTGARGPAGPVLTERLEARGVATYFPPTESIDGIVAMIDGLGERVGRRSEASALVAAMRERRQQMEAQASTRRRVRALLLFGTTPIVAAGPGSFTDEMLRLAGGENVLAGSTLAAYPTLSLEQVLAARPEVILDAAMMEHHGNEGLGPTWQAVEAVQKKHVVALSDEAILRPGPRVLDGVAALGRALDGVR